ncbi:MAG TPA: Mur ligase family protein, partial [Candidatus Dormibacteraeota bacterium]|nr:Mur ligase family protein [Candidatus Dormibacteraeota bacterium]
MTRTALELSAGLAPVRAARPIRAGERIHILGIAGAGASAAAIHALALGAIVTGCDPGGPSPYTLALEARRIPIAASHDPSHVTDGPRLDRLAVTKALTAVAPDHAELRAAANRGIPAEPWQQLIADAAFGRTLVAVAGTHGKSTTAGWLTWVLAQSGRDPSAFVGALLPAALTGGVPATARVGTGAAFVVEADEYAGNFDAYRPDVVVLTTLEWDHPDVFATRAAVISAVANWLDQVPDATLVANLDDPGVVELLGSVHASPGRLGAIVGVSLTGQAARGSATAGPAELWIDRTVVGHIVERTPDGFVLDIDGLAESTRRVHLGITGDHNASNALLALVAAAGLDAAPQDGIDRLVWALTSFPGIGRRLERKGEAGGVVVYDDYGHHPTAIRATQ